MELRTHNCGELRQSDEGKHVKLCGWLSSVRDLGAVIFFVLRDYYGYTQREVILLRSQLTTLERKTIFAFTSGFLKSRKRYFKRTSSLD